MWVHDQKARKPELEAQYSEAAGERNQTRQQMQKLQEEIKILEAVLEQPQAKQASTQNCHTDEEKQTKSAADAKLKDKFIDVSEHKAQRQMQSSSGKHAAFNDSKSHQANKSSQMSDLLKSGMWTQQEFEEDQRLRYGYFFRSNASHFSEFHNNWQEHITKEKSLH